MKKKDEISSGREQDDVRERGGPFIVSASGVKNATLSPIRNGEPKDRALATPQPILSNDPTKRERKRIHFNSYTYYYSSRHTLLRLVPLKCYGDRCLSIQQFHQ